MLAEWMLEMKDAKVLYEQGKFRKRLTASLEW